MRMAADHNLTVSVRWTALDFFQIVQNVDTHATDPYYFGFGDRLCPRSVIVIAADGNNSSDRSQFLLYFSIAHVAGVKNQINTIEGRPDFWPHKAMSI